MKDYKELSRQEFNKEAEKFDHAKVIDLYKMCETSYGPLLEEVLKEDFDSLLDVGCGTGNSIQKLQEEYAEKKYVGIDLAENMIHVAQKKNLAGTEFVVGDAENLPFKNNMFDVVICKESFHHYPNPDQFFKSAYKVLKPGGRLIILDMSIFEFARWMDNHVFLPLMKKGDVHVYNLKEVNSLLQEAGFKPERMECLPQMRMICVGRK